MTNKLWKSTHSATTCPSCAALSGQVHSEEDWGDLQPGHASLYCKENCNCTLDETDLAETGDLADVPLRQATESRLGAGSSQLLTMKAETKTMKRKPLPILQSLPVTARLSLPPRAEILPQIESGELDHLDFEARVYGTGKNKNPYTFKDDDLQNFAASFEGMPFLRNHDTMNIEARDGTIIDSTLEGQAFKQTIRLTTRRGMTDFIEGKIDRFSIGWFYDDATCSICKSSWFESECRHWPGSIYKVEGKDARCTLIFVNPTGKETSAVNTPAVEGTGITARLQEYKLSLAGAVPKLEVIGGSDNRQNPRAPRVISLLKGVNTMLVKVRRNGVVLMVEESEVLSTDERVAENEPQLAQLEANRLAAAQLLGETERMDALEAQLAESNAVLVAQCEFLLNSGLAASKLPEVVQKRIRKGFAGRAFRAPELTEAISDARTELAALSGGDNIQGPGRASFGSMINSQDQFRLAIGDLFGLAREKGEENIKVARLRGIQDAYLMATGDLDFHGGYYPEFALVTGNFPGVVANVMSKILLKEWSDLENVYGWWKNVTTVEHFNNLNQITWVRTGTIASLPTVAERAEYTELPIGDNKETSDWGKNGGYIPLTIEAVLRDDTRAFVRMPREAALAGIRNISELVAAIFTQNSAAGPVMNDTGALFNSTAQTTAGGHLNLLTTALGTDYVAWNAVATAMFKKKMLVRNASGYYGTGKPQGMKPNVVLVPADLITQAESLFMPRWESPTHLVPTSGGQTFGGHVLPVAVPEWTDATDWAAVNNLMPGIMIGEIFGVKPQIFSASSETDPAMFANDEARIKVRQFLAVGVADDMPLAKNNVA